MPLQWRYESRPRLGILALAGQLGAHDVPGLRGAIGWTLYHGTGPLIIDLAAVTRCTALGQGGIVHTSQRLAEAGRIMEVAAAPSLELILLPAEPDGEFRQWRSDGWPHAHIGL